MAWASEADLEQLFLENLRQLGFTYIPSAAVSPDLPDAQRRLRPTFQASTLEPILQHALKQLNPHVPEQVLTAARRVLTETLQGADLLSENRRVHDLFRDGIRLSYHAQGEERHAHVRLVDWQDQHNHWHVVNQFDVAGANVRIPDVVLFLNGLPLVVVELKGTEGASLEAAFNQMQTYQKDIPQLFHTNLLTVISDGLNARYGTISSGLDRYMKWRTIDGETLVEDHQALSLDVFTQGLLNRKTLLEMLRWYVVFEDEGRGPVKKIAGYHQFYAVQKSLEAILAARGTTGKGGVLWHTQGSGKSLLMTFVAGRAMKDPLLENPTILVLTDRNDLDHQLFSTFSRCQSLFGEEPVQAQSVQHLQSLLDRQVGGVIFSTIQKFRPEKGKVFRTLTTRSNVLVMVDEAHRTQYGFEAKLDKDTGELTHGFAHQLRVALPNAIYLAFTGTPVELVGADTRSVFGDYIDVYDIAQAVSDGATVPIYYEARVVKIGVDLEALSQLDAEFEENTESLDEDESDVVSQKWATVQALVGDSARLDTVVADILEHFNARVEAIDGKAMIVCMSRKICVDVYNKIIALKPEWASEADDAGAIKVVMTGDATDPLDFQPHIRSKSKQDLLRLRFKNPQDSLKLVIVRDMWLTGFDAPCMHTLYVDKPMQSHNLMQAIARVNRVFAHKPAGLIVDYIGIASELKTALAKYSKNDQAQIAINKDQAVALFLDQLDVVRTRFHGFSYTQALRGTPIDRLRLLPSALNHILTNAQENDDPHAKAYYGLISNLLKAFKLAAGDQKAMLYACEVAFFAAIRSGLEKLGVHGGKPKTLHRDFAIEQLISKAIASTEVVDILEACGFDRPDISILSETFMHELQKMQQKNLAIEALKELLNGAILEKTRTNVVQHDLFSNRLQQAIARYHNRSVDAAQVIQELIEIAKDLRAKPEDDLSPAERSFYDALAKNDTALQVMSNEDLKMIATQIVEKLQNTSQWVDWWRKEPVRAQMRVEVKKILRKNGYPPDLSPQAVQLVLRQAEALTSHLYKNNDLRKS